MRELSLLSVTGLALSILIVLWKIPFHSLDQKEFLVCSKNEEVILKAKYAPHLTLECQ